MDRVDRFAMAGVTGALVMLASFILYAFIPSPVFIITFILGIASLIGGYILVRTEHKAAMALFEAETCDQQTEPFIIDLGGTYVPDADAAVIEELS